MKEAYKTLRIAIPERAAATLARRLHLNPDYVAKWLRETPSDEAPLATGQRSILDRFDDFQAALFLVNRIGPSIVIEHLRANYDEMLYAQLDPNYWDRREHAALTLREVVEAVNCLNLEKPDEETLSELIEAREQIELAIKNLESRRGAQRVARMGARQEAKEPISFGGDRLPGEASGC